MDFHLFGMPVDPERLKELQEAQARAEMSVEAFRHGVISLIETLEKDDLLVLQRMLHAGMHDAQLEHSENVMSMWDGMIRSTASHKFNICQSCMIDHSESLFGADDSKAPVTDEEAESMVARFSGRLGIDVDSTDGDSDVRTSPFSILERDNANQYHVDDIRIEGTNEYIGVICTGINGRKEGCGSRWPSLEDRMLRDPEDCGGCHVRSAHG